METNILLAASRTDDSITIFLYNGSAKDIAINYTLILLNIFVAVHLLFSSTKTLNLHKRRHTLSIFTCVILLQVILCSGVKCIGISTIWCTIFGWIWMERKREQEGMEDIKLACTFYEANVDIPNVSLLENIVLGVDMLVLCYYAIVLEPTRTILHILAIVAIGLPTYYAMERSTLDEGPRTLRFTTVSRQCSQLLSLEPNLSLQSL